MWYWWIFANTSTWAWYWPDTRCQYKYWYIPNWNHITFFNCKSCPYSKLCQYCICLITMEVCHDPDCKLDIDWNDVTCFATVVHNSFLMQRQIFFRHFTKVTSAELLAFLQPIWSFECSCVQKDTFALMYENKSFKQQKGPCPFKPHHFTSLNLTYCVLLIRRRESAFPTEKTY